MGQSTPTTTMALDAFESRYRAFRAELHPREQRWFDVLVEAARRHSNAINRRPHMDFERPVMLAMMMESMRELEDARASLQATREQLVEVCRALTEAGLMRPRRPSLSMRELGRRGQVRLQGGGEIPRF